jgi:hypothetical protein
MLRKAIREAKSAVVPERRVARDDEEFAVRSKGGDWLTDRHLASKVPAGTPRGANGGRVTADSNVAPGGAGSIAASVAAIGSLLVASSCCLPILPFLMAAGLAGTSAFLSEIRPYLLGGSMLSIAFGFYQARRARKCSRRTNIVASILLWVSAGVVLISILFPEIMANAIAGR